MKMIFGLTIDLLHHLPVVSSEYCIGWPSLNGDGQMVGSKASRKPNLVEIVKRHKGHERGRINKKQDWGRDAAIET